MSGDPENVFEFDGDLAGDIFALEGFVGREPLGSVFIRLLLIGRTVGSEEIEGILADGSSLSFVEEIGAGFPGVAKSDDVIDLDSGGSAGSTNKVDGLAGVWVVEDTG